MTKRRGDPSCKPFRVYMVDPIVVQDETTRAVPDAAATFADRIRNRAKASAEPDFFELRQQAMGSTAPPDDGSRRDVRARSPVDSAVTDRHYAYMRIAGEMPMLLCRLAVADEKAGQPLALGRDRPYPASDPSRRAGRVQPSPKTKPKTARCPPSSR